MTRLLLIYLLILACFFKLEAQEIDDLIKQERLAYLNPKDSPEGKVSQLENGILDFQTLQQPQFIYQLSTRFPLNAKKGFKAGEVFLLSFKAKTISSEIETGEARTLWLLKQSDSYKDNLPYTLSFTSEWQEYFIPFQLTKNTKADDLNLVVQYGYRPQHFQIKDIKLGYHGNQALASLPKTKISYTGMEADAQWRKDAFERIEKHRKTTFSLHFNGGSKNLDGKKVELELIRHDFGWGAAADAQELVNNPKLVKMLNTGFNKIVFQNDLKIKAWDKQGKRDNTFKAITILKENEFDIKGHVLIWPGFQYLTPDFKTHKNDPSKIESMMKNHVADIVTSVKGSISNWDVVNEAYTNKDLQNITGSEELLFEGFKIANSMDPTAELFTNEYGIISKGGLDTQKQDWYYEFIKRIDKHTNGLVDGIGIQSHMGSDLTPPKNVYEIIDYYAQLNKNISISEFTMDILEPEIREKYTRDFMIAAFSHPAVSEFLFWGFQSPRNEKVDIFDENWQLGAMGRAFYGLISQEFHSKGVAEIKDEKLKVKGFYGTYKYTVVDGNQLYKGTFTVKPGQLNNITIDL